ncbi:MAG: FIST N-terminal domain-containing protein, partial [Bacteroidota bacterium]
MKSSLHNFRKGSIQHIAGPKPLNDAEAQLVICFGSKSMLSDESETERISTKFPNADIVFCTTSGEIFNDSVVDNTIVATAIAFEKSTFK